MTLEQWLLPVNPDDACGPDLAYDPDFLALEESVRVQPGQEFRRDGATITVAAADTRWPAVLEQSQALLARSKDLRLAVLLTRALLHVEGFPGIANGLALIRQLLHDRWDGLHPRLEPEDGDPTMRLNALAALNAFDSVLGDVRASLILDSRQHGRLRVRDIEVALGRIEPLQGEVRLARPELDGLLDVALRLAPELAGQSAAALHDLDALLVCLDERVGIAPDLSDLRAMLQLVVAALGAVSQSPVRTGNSVAGIASAGSPGISRDTPVADIPATIDCREDVVRWLAILCQYLERNEPTNPVQILLRRAQRMMTMNFLQLMQDMAPDGLEQAEKVVGEKLGNGDD